MEKATFAIRLKELRRELKLSQIEISKKLGISQSTYKSWEAGDCGTNIEMLIKLAEFFGVTTDYLLGRTDI